MIIRNYKKGTFNTFNVKRNVQIQKSAFGKVMHPFKGCFSQNKNSNQSDKNYYKLKTNNKKVPHKLGGIWQLFSMTFLPL